jgi:tetratricopeptide (TPR) repeat protein/beta-lactamase regulating signal transducer with metallopeptidase domain
MAALGLVLVISIGFRSLDIAWTQPTLPVLLEENRAHRLSFPEPDELSPAETIALTNPFQSQISNERDMIHSVSATSFHPNQLAVLLILIVNSMGFVWIMGFLFQLLRLVHGVILVKKFRESLPSLPDASFNEMVRDIAGAFWKNRMPELYSSPKIESPITIGLLNPIVIIPEKLFTALSENELKSILLHELAHIYHYDQVMGVIKRIVLAVHWWNPLVYIINREHEQAREEVSDNYVLRELHPKVYIQCLADLAEKVCLISNFPTAVGMTGKCSSLPTRVEHILSKKRSVAMCAKIYVKTITVGICFILTLGVGGLHGKVESERPGEPVIENQENGSTIEPVSFVDEEQRILPEKAFEFDVTEKKDQDNFSGISSEGTAVRTETSDKPILKSVSPAIVMAHAGIQTPENPEKKTESVGATQAPVLNIDGEYRVVQAREEPPVDLSLNEADIQETRVIEPESEDAAEYISLGVSCFKKGEITDAMTHLNRAIDLDPGKAVAYFARGSVYYELDQLDNAVSDYTKAIQIDPEFAVAYQNRGSVYVKLDRFDDAISDYSKAIQVKPDFALAYRDRGSVYGKRGRSSRAISDYSKAIELNPEDALTYTYRGTVYFSKERYQKALIDFNRAIELDPEYADAYINRGSYYHTKGKYRKALADYKKALELDPETAFARKLNKYLSYESALYLYRFVHYISYSEKSR